MFYLKNKDFLRFKNLVYKEIGILFDDNNAIVLIGRITDRLKVLKINDPEDYYDFLLKDEKELMFFLDSVTTNLTMFFRNQSIVKIISKYIIPDLQELKKKNNERSINIWSAGCSSGEEVYTLAMIFDRFLSRDFTFKVNGTDISQTSLNIAKKGIYNRDKVKNLPLDYLNYLNPLAGNQFQVNEKIMNKVNFSFHNLIKPSYFFDLDLVICLNVLIYFSKDIKINIVNNFAAASKKGSFLILGFSDILSHEKYEIYKTDYGSIFRRK